MKTGFKVSDIDQDREHADVPGDWHFKLSPLDNHLQERFQDVVTLGSKISYDEMMLPFRGRSAHRTKCLGKPHLDGFKVWCICQKDICTIGYTFQALQVRFVNSWC
jgi:hypothetical protein